MEDKKPKGADDEPTMHVNEYGTTKDSAVVVEEKDRTVLLTDRETIVIPKTEMFDIRPHRERKVYGGMWGTTELAVVGVAMLAVAATIMLYVFGVFPAKRELAVNRERLADANKKFVEATARFGNITDTKTRVAELVRSTDDFQARFLPPRVSGEATLYQQINGLISAYRLTNTAGPDYAPLEVNETGRQDKSETEGKGRAKMVSFYPGTYVTMTVEGSYQNLRRFIRELETSNQFLVISNVELEPSEGNSRENEIDPTKPPPKLVTTPVPGRPNPQPGFGGATYVDPTGGADEPAAARSEKGKTHGETVTLRIELAAYFRRTDFAPMPATDLLP